MLLNNLKRKREGRASGGDREETVREIEITSPGFHIRPVNIVVWQRETYREKFWNLPLACCPGTWCSHLSLVTYTICMKNKENQPDVKHKD